MTKSQVNLSFEISWMHINKIHLIETLEKKIDSDFILFNNQSSHFTLDYKQINDCKITLMNWKPKPIFTNNDYLYFFITSQITNICYVLDKLFYTFILTISLRDQHY